MTWFYELLKKTSISVRVNVDPSYILMTTQNDWTKTFFDSLKNIELAFIHFDLVVTASTFSTKLKFINSFRI